MTPEELVRRIDGDSDSLSWAVLIEYQGIRGVAIKLGESLGDPWQSGDIVVFWQDGDSTALPDNFGLIVTDLWGWGKG